MTKILFPTVIALCAIVPANAQAPEGKPAIRYTIKTESSLTTERQMLRDGEDMGRGRFGGGGDENTPTVTKSEVVFAESLDGTKWRRYETFKGSVKRPGRDGEPFESEVEGALAGKKLVFAEGKVLEGDASGEPLDERLGDGLPVATDLHGLVPAGDLAVDAKFELDGKFGTALQCLVHPIRAAAGTPGDTNRGGDRRRRRDGDENGGEDAPKPPEGKDGNDRPDEPRGGDDQPGQRPRRRGGDDGADPRAGRGAFGRMRGPFGINDTALDLIASGKLDWKGTGIVKAHEEHDGKQFAVVELTATGKGEGTAEDLGLGFARFGRRGGMGGDVESEAKASIALQGRMLVELQSRAPHSLSLTGNVESVSDSFMTRRDTEIEIHAETRGPFKMDVTCEACTDPTELAKPSKE
ncbi:MAG: hypothetical protein KDB80_11160 [Planctomycetes bacterium]|nr:hypothetical protein [Planctomycetota bacterium]